MTEEITGCKRLKKEIEINPRKCHTESYEECE